MDNQSAEFLEELRSQYEYSPYPRKPLDTSPKDETNLLFIHSYVTAYYLRYQKVIDTKNKIILDAGCGSGWKSLLLAYANPGAKIVGVDLSETSVKLAENRLKYWGYDNCEFFAIPLEEVASLGMKFDYINCDETLYLLPDADPGNTLKIFKSVLNQEGIIRTNLHHIWQRNYIYRAQNLFQYLGFTQDNPEDFEVTSVIDIMKALKNQVDLKQVTWRPSFEEPSGVESILMNYLLKGDKGYTVPEMFAALNKADLEFISMVNWRQWELMDLFNEPDNLPTVLAMILAEASVEDRLNILSLLHPVNNRTLDFWCGHPQSIVTLPASEWSDADWENTSVYLHPQLQNQQVQEKLLNCISRQQNFEISATITHPTAVPIVLESTVAACLLPLWDGPKSFKFLVNYWLKLQPNNLVTLEAKNEEEATSEIKNLFLKLESFLYLLFDKN